MKKVTLLTGIGSIEPLQPGRTLRSITSLSGRHIVKISWSLQARHNEKNLL